nr:PREDICTED: DC-STAMP domain-containing protein 1 [Bemisia tabaci]
MRGNYLLIYKGVDKSERAHAGVGMLVHKNLIDNIIDIDYISERILKVIIYLGREKLNLISIYAPDTSRGKPERDTFYESLQKVIDTIPAREKLVMMGDWNARVGNNVVPGIKNRFNEPTLNDSGEELIEFCAINELRINNTFFDHPLQQKITWTNRRGQASMIDFIISNRHVHPQQILDVRTLSSADAGVATFFSEHVPYWDEVVNSDENEHRVAKKFSAFIFGLLIGLLLYEIIVVDLQFDALTAYVLGASISLILAFGNAISSQIRCMTLLSLPSFCGGSGQSVVQALIVAYLIAGPVTNLAVNSREVVRVFACSTELTYNLTKTRFSLMFKPFKTAISQMRADTTGVKDTLSSIRDIMSPIKQELEGDEEVKEIIEDNDYINAGTEESIWRLEEIEKLYNESLAKSRGEAIETKYIRKLHARCEGMITQAVAKCKRVFANSFDTCWEKLHWAVKWALCWPMKLDFICNVGKVFGNESVCDPGKIIAPGFGSSFQYMEKSVYEFKEGFRKVQVQIQIDKATKLVEGVQDAYSAAQAVQQEFQVKQRVAMFFFKLTNIILAFSFLAVILRVSAYMTNYLTSIEYDNVYITRYFRKIDARRRRQGHHTLLPLKKLERKKYIDLYNLRITPKERWTLYASWLRTFLEFLFASSIIFIDFLFYEALKIVESQSRIDYVQEGHHYLYLSIEGTGMIASLIRSVVRGFKVNKKIKKVFSNEGIKFKREKRRILFLYNELLRKRRAFFRYRLAKVKKLAAENKLMEDFNLIIMLRLRFPKLFGWLADFKIGQRHCLICNEAEHEGASISCGDPMCQYVFCAECWEDVQHVCYGCAPVKIEAHEAHDAHSEVFNTELSD